MGNAKSKVHNFSLRMMDPYSNTSQGHTADDFKAIEDERNRALADKKRFAIRLSEVEENISKKNDVIKELQDQIKELSSLLSRSKAENKVLGLDIELAKQSHQLSVMEINESRKEAEMLRNKMLAFITSYQELPSHSTLLSKSSPMISTIDTLVANAKDDVQVLKKTIQDLLNQLQEKEYVKTSLSEQLKKVSEEFSRFQKDKALFDLNNEKLESRLTFKSDTDAHSNNNNSKSLPSVSFTSQDSLPSTGSSVVLLKE